MNTTDAMINFTPAAIAHIKKMQIKPSDALRLSVKKTGCSGYAYVTDLVAQGKEHDLCYEFEGVKVFVDANSVDLLKGTTIDFIDKGMGQTKLVFHNPNAGNLCGCGESFTIDNDE